MAMNKDYDGTPKDDSVEVTFSFNDDNIIDVIEDIVFHFKQNY
jgi:hypothetical protein